MQGKWCPVKLKMPARYKSQGQGYGIFISNIFYTESGKWPSADCISNLAVPSLLGGLALTDSTGMKLNSNTGIEKVNTEQA